jgi:uncharacterized protein YlxW (UPF0749 family)
VPEPTGPTGADLPPRRPVAGEPSDPPPRDEPAAGPERSSAGSAPARHDIPGQRDEEDTEAPGDADRVRAGDGRSQHDRARHGEPADATASDGPATAPAAAGTAPSPSTPADHVVREDTVPPDTASPDVGRQDTTPPDVRPLDTTPPDPREEPGPGRQAVGWPAGRAGGAGDERGWIDLSAPDVEPPGTADGGTQREAGSEREPGPGLQTGRESRAWPEPDSGPPHATSEPSEPHVAGPGEPIPPGSPRPRRPRPQSRPGGPSHARPPGRPAAGHGPARPPGPAASGPGRPDAGLPNAEPADQPADQPATEPADIAPPQGLELPPLPVEPAEPEVLGSGPAGPDDSKTPRERLADALLHPRFSRGQALAALLLALLGFAVALQVRSTNEDSQLRGARQSDLIRILDDVSDRSEFLEAEKRKLELNRDQLRSGTGRTEAAVQQAKERAKTLGILAGTLKATGTGIEFTISDPGQKVDATVLLDALQELRDAKAEAVQINDVRVVADTDFVDGSPGHVLVDGQMLTPPYVFKVIGDSSTLASALRIPGGVLEVLKGKGAEGLVKQSPRVDVDALRQPEEPRYARPASD